MVLTRQYVQKVARLARLELDELELERQTTHLNRLLEQFEKLSAVNTDGIAPTSHSIPVYNVVREDVVASSLTRTEVLSNAPENRDGYFIVPRILGGE